MIRIKFGEIISAKKIKQIKISNDTGISRNTLSSIANNATDMIKLETIGTLCTYLGITPGDFFEFHPAVVSVNADINFVGPLNEFEVTVLTTFKESGLLKDLQLIGNFYVLADSKGSLVEGRLHPDQDFKMNALAKEYIAANFTLGLQTEISGLIEKAVQNQFKEEFNLKCNISNIALM